MIAEGQTIENGSVGYLAGIVITNKFEALNGYRVETRKGGLLIGHYNATMHSFKGVLEMEGVTIHGGDVGRTKQKVRAAIEDRYNMEMARRARSI